MHINTILSIAVHIRADKNNKAGYPIEFMLRNLLVRFFITLSPEATSLVFCPCNSARIVIIL